MNSSSTTTNANKFVVITQFMIDFIYMNDILTGDINHKYVHKKFECGTKMCRRCLALKLIEKAKGNLRNVADELFYHVCDSTSDSASESKNVEDGIDVPEIPEFEEILHDEVETISLSTKRILEEYSGKPTKATKKMKLNKCSDKNCNYYLVRHPYNEDEGFAKDFTNNRLEKLKQLGLLQ